MIFAWDQFIYMPSIASSLLKYPENVTVYKPMG